MKEGLSTARQYQGRPMNRYTKYIKTKNRYGEEKSVGKLVCVENLTLSEKQANHKKRHPNDKNQKKIKGIFWGKKGYKDTILEEFYEAHIHTFIDSDLNKGWVKIGGEEE
tara:strand:+ start:653 stop:982 length:330 start_codon:yes stop_codon:yes gene_type:complete